MDPSLASGIGVLGAIVSVLVVYQKWQSVTAKTTLKSDEFQKWECGLRADMEKEAQATRDLLRDVGDGIGRSLDRLEKNTATKADIATLTGKVRALELVNQIIHGVKASQSDSDIQRFHT